VVLTIPLLVRGEILSVGSPMSDPILPHVVDYSITSSYQRIDQPATLRILTPTGGINNHTRFLYLLPVQSGTPSTFNYYAPYGDGMTVAHQLQLNDTYNLVVVAPSFNEPIPTFQQSTGPDPWYGDHPSNRWIRQESYFVNDIVPLVDSLYPTRNKQRLLLGYSKSGWGALNLILRHPDVFDAAASWDAPLMLNTVVPRSYSGEDIVFGSN
jgi:S-formylglutathione hydrolase FrmB